MIFYYGSTFIPDDTGTSLKVDQVKQKAARFLNELRFDERRIWPLTGKACLISTIFFIKKFGISPVSVLGAISGSEIRNKFFISGTEKAGKRENLIYICENKDEKDKNRHSFLPVVYFPFF